MHWEARRRQGVLEKMSAAQVRLRNEDRIIVRGILSVETKYFA